MGRWVCSDCGRDLAKQSEITCTTCGARAVERGRSPEDDALSFDVESRALVLVIKALRMLEPAAAQRVIAFVTKAFEP